MRSGLAALLLWCAVASAEPLPTDPVTGLRIAPGWEQARAHCGACHSYRLVTGNRGDERHWRGLIEWMQRTQNLWAIPEPALSELLGYLARAYPPAPPSRRAPLPLSLRPPSLSPEGP